MFGSGWVAAADRGTLMEDLRGPAEIATLDVPGLDAINLALSLRRFDPSAESEQFVTRQISLLRTHGRKGEQVIADMRAYVDGINAQNRGAGRAVEPVDGQRRDLGRLADRRRVRQGRRRRDPPRRAAERAAAAARPGRGRAGVERPARASGSRGAGLARAARFPYGASSSGDPATPSSTTELRRQSERAHPPRPPLRARPDAAARAARPARQQRAAGLCAPLGERASAVRGRSPGRLLLSRDPDGGGPPRRRHRRARRRLPGRRPLRAGRPRPGLRLERDLGGLGRHRPVRRDALRQRHHATASRAGACR